MIRSIFKYISGIFCLCMLTFSCEKEGVSETPPQDRIPVKLNISLSNSSDDPSISAAALAEENTIRRVNIFTFGVPANAADQTNPAKYRLGGTTEVYDNMNPIPLDNIVFYMSAKENLKVDIYVILNLPATFTEKEVTKITNFQDLLNARISINSQYKTYDASGSASTYPGPNPNPDYRGLTMCGQQYSIDPNSLQNSQINIKVYRLAAKVNFTSEKSGTPLIWFNIESKVFLNLPFYSCIVPSLPNRSSIDNSTTYCPELSLDSRFVASSYTTWRYTYGGESPSFGAPGSGNIPPVWPLAGSLGNAHMNNNYVAYRNFTLTNSSTTHSFYIFPNNNTQYPTIAMTRISPASPYQSNCFCPLAITDGGITQVKRNREYTLKIGMNNPAKAKTNPWQFRPTGPTPAPKSENEFESEIRAEDW